MKLKEKPEDFMVREIPNLTMTPGGGYLIFRMKKKLLNTEEAVQEIANKSGLARKNLGYSGAKDRKAVTEQFISVIGTSKEKIESLGIDNLELEYMGRSSEPISLGDHLGNEFEITARECEKEPKKKEKIVNYFGQQRFSHNNEEVGKAIVKKDFERACSLIKEAGGRNAETITNHLKRNENDHVGALKKLPTKTAQLYVHAYQSHLWNRVAERLATMKKNISIPILGFGTNFENQKIRETYEGIMREEDISKKGFAIRQYTKISAEGTRRELYTRLQDLNIESIDEQTYRITFFLPKGSYATVAVNQLFQR